MNRISECMADAERAALHALAAGDFVEFARWAQSWDALNHAWEFGRQSPFRWISEEAKRRAG